MNILTDNPAVPVNPAVPTRGSTRSDPAHPTAVATPRLTRPGPVLVCADCDDEYHWTDSSSLERCHACAALTAEFLDVPEASA